MGKRRKSREIALQALYWAEVNPLGSRETVDVFWQDSAPPEDVKGFASKIVDGVCRHREAIDSLLECRSEHWKLDRMDVIDRNILRMGVFELLYCDEIPRKVTINEAIELGKKFGSEESGAFINGILDKIGTEERRG